MNTVNTKINTYICGLRPNIDINNNDEFLDYRGLNLDSIEFLTLIIYLEDEFEIEFADEELIINNYEKISDLINKVKEKCDNDE